MNPGSLGMYGFRHRRPGTYWDTYIPFAGDASPPARLGPALAQRQAGVRHRHAPGYPPPVNGVYISDFLTPDGAKDFVTPQSLAPEILAVAGGYEFDVTFRAEDRQRIGEELIDMTRKRWAVARHLWAKEKWDLFALHEIGPGSDPPHVLEVLRHHPPPLRGRTRRTGSSSTNTTRCSTRRSASFWRSSATT